MSGDDERLEGDALSSPGRTLKDGDEKTKHGDDEASPSTERLVKRSYPAHPPPIETGNRAVIIFLTVCSAKRKRILANDEAVAVILAAWHLAVHWLVGRYVILPDHIHLFCAPARADALGVQRWARYWKGLASRRWPRQERTSDLADGPVGYATAPRRELRREVGLRAKQSCATRSR